VTATPSELVAMVWELTLQAFEFKEGRPVEPRLRRDVSALSGAAAEHLVVGAHALAAHGLPRATGHLDVLVRPTPENAERIWRALVAFGAPLQDLTRADLCSPDIVFQIGVVPCRIDILTAISGVDFDEAWTGRMIVRIGGLDVPVLGRDALLRNKRASGRPKDLLDVPALESEE
jgi:hypothetical protein